MSLLSTTLLFAIAIASIEGAEQPMTDMNAGDAPVHMRCMQLRTGMNYRDALAIMGRDPDSTLSGHTAAGPDGDPPAGSYAIDFWYNTDAQGAPVVSSFRYSGGVLESVDCARPRIDPLPSSTNPPET